MSLLRLVCSVRDLSLCIFIPLSLLRNMSSRALKNHHRVFVLHESAAPADTLTISRFGQLFQTDAVHEQQGNGNEGNVSVLNGPEGGFSGDEVFSMAKAGARIFKLPGYILRAETASILAASLFGVLTAP